MCLAVWTAHSNGIQTDISGNLRGIEVTNELFAKVGGKLRSCQFGHVLDPPRAGLGKTIHVQESAVGLVDEQYQKKGEEAAKDTNVGLFQ